MEIWYVLTETLVITAQTLETPTVEELLSKGL